MEETVFRHIKIYNSIGPPTGDGIREIEELIEAKLPVDYLEFLKVANGGFYEFCIHVDGEELTFGDVYHTGKDSSGSYGFGTIVGEIQQARKGFIDIPI